MNQRPNWSAREMDMIPERVLSELEATRIERGRPLVVVDADEVLVHFAEHFARWLEARKYRFQLVEYKLNSAISRENGEVLTRDEVFPLIWGFVTGETRHQPEISGASAALARLSELAQVVVLTNAPPEVTTDRIANLASHGINYPVVMNEGGKGRALRWLAEMADAPTVFVDDSIEQLNSAARRTEGLTLLHLVGPEMLKPVVGPAEAAHHHPQDWNEAEALIREAIAAA